METLNKYFGNLAKAAFVRHGFASEQIVSQWDAVVGPAISAFCLPDKIIWPKSASEMVRKSGGTLVLRAHAGRALELQYETPRIMERVNQFLGYGAITAVKVIQTNFSPPQPQSTQKPMTASAIAAWDEKIADITDEYLKLALARLAANAAPHGPKQRLSTGENRDWPLNSTSVRKNS
jgi:hypothetical protein